MSLFDKIFGKKDASKTSLTKPEAVAGIVLSAIHSGKGWPSEDERTEIVNILYNDTQFFRDYSAEEFILMLNDFLFGRRELGSQFLKAAAEILSTEEREIVLAVASKFVFILKGNSAEKRKSIEDLRLGLNIPEETATVIIQSPKRYYKWPEICSTMIQEIDSVREHWFSTMVVGWFEEYTSMGIVNTSLKSDINIGMEEENSPETFPFNNISGETIEAALMGWQLEVATAFALKQNYIARDELRDFWGVLLKKAYGRSERWVLSAGARFGKEPLAIEDIAQALAYYMMNETVNSDSVTSVAKELESRGMPILAIFTHLAVATAFADDSTMQQIMAKIKPE